MKHAPDLVFRDSSDKPFRLSDDKGRLVLLSIGNAASEPGWINPLGHEQKKYEGSGLAVVGVWVDTGGQNSLEAYLSSPKVSKPDYPIVLGSVDDAQAFGPGSLPMTVLIDRSGRIAAFQSSDGTGADPLYCTYEAAVKALVAEP